jgi:hypothetical protein
MIGIKGIAADAPAVNGKLPEIIVGIHGYGVCVS